MCVCAIDLLQLVEISPIERKENYDYSACQHRATSDNKTRRWISIHSSNRLVFRRAITSCQGRGMPQRRILFFNSKSYDERTFRDALKALNAQDKLHFTFLESKLSEETITEAQGYDGICIVNSAARNSNVMDKIHKLCDTVKIVALRSAGHSGSSVEPVKQFGLHICRVPTYSPHAVAEHSVALLLSLNRNLHHAFFRTKLHNFTLDGLVGIDLFGKTVGIIGTGGIGMCAVKIFLGFGCKVLCYDIKPDEAAAKAFGFTYTTMDELLQQSDIGRVVGLSLMRPVES